MSLVKAKEYLQKYGLEDKIMEFNVSKIDKSKFKAEFHTKAKMLKNRTRSWWSLSFWNK